MIKLTDLLPEIKVGDKIRIVTSRTKGSRSYEIIVNKIINKNKVRGTINIGNEAGTTVIGSPIKENKNSLREVKVVKVPKFKTGREAAQFISTLPSNATVNDDVINYETGEVLMEPGDTKTKMVKQKLKRIENLYDKWDRFHFFNDSHSNKQDFEEMFNVVYKNNIKGMDKDEIEMLRNGDYNPDFDFPSKIKRKDGKPFTKNDVENIENFADWYAKYVLPYGVKINAYAQRGKKIAETEPMYV